VAATLGVGMHRDNSIIAALHKRFAERRIAMPPNNAKQADILDGAVMLANGNGSAPGQFLVTTYEGKRRIVVLLPGPPKELKPLFTSRC